MTKTHRRKVLRKHNKRRHARHEARKENQKSGSLSPSPTVVPGMIHSFPTNSQFIESFDMDSSGNSFAGFSPSNNVFEEEDYDLNNSFETDFLADDDFETFSFNDMEDIFDRDLEHNSASETEASEDDHNKGLLEDIETSFSSDYLQYFNSDEDSFEADDFSIDEIRGVRICRSLNSFSDCGRGIFVPNTFAEAPKSALKTGSSLTFIVSAKNGDTKDATRYATEINSENCEGVPFPQANETVLLPETQAASDHAKAAIIQAHEIKLSEKNAPEKKTGFYTESALRQFLRGRAWGGRKNMLFSLSAHGKLRSYSSSIQLNQSKSSHVSPNAIIELQDLTGTPEEAPRTKSVKWAQKLEW